MNFKVALLQMESQKDEKAAIKKGLEYLKKAKELDADIALFPEMWNIGYAFPEDSGNIDKWNEVAVNEKSEYYEVFRKKAIEYQMAIGLTYLERKNGLPGNTISIIDMKGKEILKYSKVHTCDFSPEVYCGPGDDFYVSKLEYKEGSLDIGCMICYDREFPEAARILMLKGAEIVLVPNACMFDVNRKNQLATRAFENMFGVAMTNYAGNPFFGRSMAFDGMGGEINRNMLLVEGGPDEGVYVATFNMDILREYRKRNIWGDSYRKPSKYKALLEENKLELFKRDDSRRKKGGKYG